MGQYLIDLMFGLKRKLGPLEKKNPLNNIIDTNTQWKNTSAITIY